MANTLIHLKRGNGLFNTNTQLANTLGSTLGTIRSAEPWINQTAKQLWVDDLCINPNLISNNNALTIGASVLNATSNTVERLFTINVSADADNALTIHNDGLYSSNTHWTSKNIIASTTSAIVQSTTALSDGEVCLNHIENGVNRSGHKIIGAGVAQVTWDAASGAIKIYAPDQSSGDIALGRLVKNTGYSSGWYYTGGLYTGTATTTLKWGIYHDKQNAAGVGTVVEFQNGSSSDITEGASQIKMKITIIDGGTF